MGDMPDISSILAMLNSMSNNKEADAQESKDQNHATSPDASPIDMPDMEMMMKLISIMRSLNSNDASPSANLLISLKPFLKEHKKEQIDQYIKMIKIINVISKMNAMENETEIKEGGEDTITIIALFLLLFIK